MEEAGRDKTGEDYQDLLLYLYCIVEQADGDLLYEPAHRRMILFFIHGSRAVTAVALVVHSLYKS